MQILPCPTLDHVVVNVRDRLDDAEILYRRLGFTLTPRGYHSLGSINHLAIFGTDYLELIAVPPGKTDRNDILRYPFGLNGLVFGAEESEQLYRRLIEAGVPVQPPNHFVRPVELPDGTHQDAAFNTIRLTEGVVPAGRLYFCQHLTRHLVWRDEWRSHANATTGVVRATICSDTPAVLGALLARMFGQDAVLGIPCGQRLVIGLSSFDIVTPDEIARRFGPRAPDPQGRRDYMAALTLRTRGLEAASAALRAGGIAFDQTADRVQVAAAETMGATLEFVA
jgi:hypothetical protein